MRSTQFTLFSALWALSTLAIATVSIGDTSTNPGTNPGVQAIPDGYRPGLPGAIYGTYNSVVGPQARNLQSRLLFLEKKAYGLTTLSSVNHAEQAEAVYLLEAEVLRLHQDIANAPKETLTQFERASLLYGSVRTYGVVRVISERLFEDVIRYIDVKKPGPNGLQIRSEIDASESVYRPNFRTPRTINDTEKKNIYDQKLAKFLAAGGSMEEISRLSPSVLKRMGGLTHVEYVVRQNDEIWVTEGSAGHVLLAEGKEVKAAGQMLFLKNATGSFTMLVVSNASGSYKPDLYSVQLLASKLSQQLGLDAESVLVTKGDPMATQAVQLYLKADGVDEQTIRETTEKLAASAKEIFTRGAKTWGCEAAFSARL